MLASLFPHASFKAKSMAIKGKKFGQKVGQLFADMQWREIGRMNDLT